MSQIQSNSKKISVELTDIMIHAQEMRKSKSWIYSIISAFQGKKSGRLHTNNITIEENGTFEIALPITPEIQAQIDRAKKEGKEIDIVLPEGGVPVFADKDLPAFIKNERKRDSGLDRIFAKNNIM